MNGRLGKRTRMYSITLWVEKDLVKFRFRELTLSTILRVDQIKIV
jgi:hypothetical protein